MVKLNIALGLSALLISNSFAKEMTLHYSKKSKAQRWEKKVFKDFDLTPKYHGFCYNDKNGKIQGLNPHRRVRLASVTKLITTLWAAEELGPDYNYTTKFYLKDSHLHIDGDLDPVFSKRKLFFLISQLNNLGIYEIEKLTFNKNLRVFTKAEGYVGNLINVTPSRTAQNLKDYFNTDSWERLKVAYEQFIAQTPESIIDQLQIKRSLNDISLKVNKIELLNENPFLNDKEAVQEHTHLSAEIATYLKYMNIKSNNYIADQVFEKLGGEQGFKDYIAPFMAKNFKNYNKTRIEFSKGEPSIGIYTGSGLNTTRNGSRVDNFATCAIVVKLIEKLDKVLLEKQAHIKDLVAVPGTDGGTFRKRLNTPRLTNTMVAKTGTLFHTSALAGKVYTKKGDRYFGMFYQSTGWKGNAKMAQNELVSELIDHNGGPVKFNYKKSFFFPAFEPMN